MGGRPPVLPMPSPPASGRRSSGLALPPRLLLLPRLRRDTWGGRWLTAQAGKDGEVHPLEHSLPRSSQQYAQQAASELQC